MGDTGCGREDAHGSSDAERYVICGDGADATHLSSAHATGASAKSGLARHAEHPARRVRHAARAVGLAAHGAGPRIVPPFLRGIGARAGPRRCRTTADATMDSRTAGWPL